MASLFTGGESAGVVFMIITTQAVNASPPPPAFPATYFGGRRATGPFFLTPIEPTSRVTFGTAADAVVVRIVRTHGNDTDNYFGTGSSGADLAAMAPGDARGPRNRGAARISPIASSTLYTRIIVVASMNTRRRKDISRRSRAHSPGGCWYGRLVRSLERCASAGSRDQRRNLN